MATCDTRSDMVTATSDTLATLYPGLAYNYQQYAMGIGTWTDDVKTTKPRLRFKDEFHRINRLVEYFEDDKLEEPLDALRIKVAQWLNPKEHGR